MCADPVEARVAPNFEHAEEQKPYKNAKTGKRRGFRQARLQPTAVGQKRTGCACCPNHDEHASDDVPGMVGVAKEECEKRCWQRAGCHKNTREVGSYQRRVGLAKTSGCAVPHLARKSSILSCVSLPSRFQGRDALTSREICDFVKL